MLPGIIAALAAAASTLGIFSVLGGRLAFLFYQRGAPWHVPGWDTTFYGKRKIAPVTTAKLMREIVDKWHAKFGNGDIVEAALNKNSVHLLKEIEHNGKKYNGRTLSRVTTYLALDHPKKRKGIYATLQHEFVHTFLWATTGEPDADHSQAERWGDTWTKEHDDFLASLTRYK